MNELFLNLLLQIHISSPESIQYLVNNNTSSPAMAVRHFAEGSLKPALQDNVSYLFSMRFCPYAHRVHLVLNAKNVKFEPIFINLASKPKWYLEMFPSGRVPTFLYKGSLLYDSLLLAEFLNDEFAGNALHHSEPIKKYKDRLLIQNFGEVSSAFYKNAMVEFSEQNFNDLLSSIGEYEKELDVRKTNYFGGDEKPHMVDYMIWPWFERLGVLAFLYGDDAKILMDKFPRLSEWISRMKVDASVQRHYLTAEQHGKHFKLRKANDSNAFDGII